MEPFSLLLDIFAGWVHARALEIITPIFPIPAKASVSIHVICVALKR